ncbi:shikimate kinase [Candidatus Hydrogenosomobacter endosymbioticus]|uniref:Shikimate kinase n=1 Tax=Candidatus Hydrogenosomobacter endosymbioticus TaxID=2558174 RepID=A0ABM7V806_9PROT|nr:shikimate kinase [Candidatus Hydrogenosomobacter endosymbioticus]BDB95892.1 shikimate kinase [Candidatus Hydrogenosomobacter endosymbioticus]
MKIYDFAPFYVPKIIAIIGMMGSGKSTIGRRLAKKLGMPFFDSDQEVEAASGGYSVASICDQWGEAAFRDVEFKVIKRLIETQPVHVLSTGDGAFMNESTRSLLQESAITVWLKADINTIALRIQSRKAKPKMFEEEGIEAALQKITEERYPVYRLADIHVESDDETYQDTVMRVLSALKEFLYPNS